MTVELVRHPSGDGYVTRDGRWRVRHDPMSSCAPQRWWWITDTKDRSVWRECALPTLEFGGRRIAWQVEAEGSEDIRAWREVEAEVKPT